MPEKKNTKKNTTTQKRKTPAAKKKKPSVKKKQEVVQETIDIFDDAERADTESLLNEEKVQEEITSAEQLFPEHQENKEYYNEEINREETMSTHHHTNVARLGLGFFVIVGALTYLLQVSEFIPEIFPEWMDPRWWYAIVMVILGLFFTSGRGWVSQIFSILLLFCASAVIVIVLLFSPIPVEESTNQPVESPVSEEVSDTEEKESSDDEEEAEQEEYVNNPNFDVRTEAGESLLYLDDEPTGLAVVSETEEGTKIPFFVAISEDEDRAIFNYWNSETGEMIIAVSDISGENAEDLFVANDSENETNVVLDSIEWIDESEFSYRTSFSVCDVYCVNSDDFTVTEQGFIYNLETGESREEDGEESADLE